MAKDTCVLCGAETPYEFETHIDWRRRWVFNFILEPDGREKEVRFEWNGWLCDFAGLPTGEVISLK